MNFAFNVALPPWMAAYNEVAHIRSMDYINAPTEIIAPRMVPALQIAWVCNVILGRVGGLGYDGTVRGIVRYEMGWGGGRGRWQLGCRWGKGGVG